MIDIHAIRARHQPVKCDACSLAAVYEWSDDGRDYLYCGAHAFGGEGAERILDEAQVRADLAALCDEVTELRDKVAELASLYRCIRQMLAMEQREAAELRAALAMRAADLARGAT